VSKAVSTVGEPDDTVQGVIGISHLGDSARVDSQFFHARDQRRTFDAHAGGCALRACNTALGLFEDVQNLIAVFGLSRALRGNGSSVAADFSNW